MSLINDIVQKSPLPVAFGIFTVVLLVVAYVAPATTHHDDPIEQLRKTQAVQAVELQDARERIRVLEVELDRLAPHTPKESTR